jgi:hypothetical protein
VIVVREEFCQIDGAYEPRSFLQEEIPGLFVIFLLNNIWAACWLLSFLEFVVKRAWAQVSEMGPAAFIPDLRMVWGSVFLE